MIKLIGLEKGIYEITILNILFILEDHKIETWIPQKRTDEERSLQWQTEMALSPKKS